jgi:hypothetical protein
MRWFYDGQARGLTVLTVAKDAKGELENNSRKPRDLLKNRHSDRQKRVNLLFLRG